MTVKTPADVRKSILESDFKEKLIESAETHLSFNVETGFVTLRLKTGKYINTDVIKGTDSSIGLSNYRPFIPLEIKAKKKKLKPRLFSDLHFHPLKTYFKEERDSNHLIPSVISKTGGDIASAIKVFNDTRKRHINYVAGIYSFEDNVDIGILAFQLSKEYEIKNRYRTSRKSYPEEEIEELRKDLIGFRLDLKDSNMNPHKGNRMISKYLNEHEYFNSFYFRLKNERFYFPKRVWVD